MQLLRQPDGSSHLYCTASREKHGVYSRNCSSLLTYRIRKDGFSYVRSRGGSGVGVVGTRGMRWGGGPLELNVDAGSAGSVRVAVSDEYGKRPLRGMSFENSAPFRGDDVAFRPSWGGNGGTAPKPGENVSVQVELSGTARLYAVRGRFTPFCFTWEGMSQPCLPGE